jgi:hypothetical protein
LGNKILNLKMTTGGMMGQRAEEWAQQARNGCSSLPFGTKRSNDSECAQWIAGNARGKNGNIHMIKFLFLFLIWLLDLGYGN